MKLLVLDHFFGQDIEALFEASGGDVDWRVWSYHPIRWEALRVFPEEVATGVEAFASPSLERERAEFARVFEGLLHEQFMRFAFDAFVVPSDVFFYVRSAPAACHALGVPFFVAQKETTIAEHTMVEHAARIRRFAPPSHDHMTVCSERHKQFWVRAGADPASITVTGQPRFDYYARRQPRPPDAQPTVLFFSYHVDAYHPEEGAAPVWATLHQQTLDGLSALAAEGWRVLVKPHPQQTPPRLPAGMELVEGRADTRELIAGADAVVGFQTTALFEAMLARKPVLYTAWDPEAVRLGSSLIPFAEWDAGITVLRSPDELAPAVRSRLEVTEAQMTFRRGVAEEYLGPVDGRASERTLEVIRRVVSEFPRTPGANALRESLARRRPPRRIGRQLRMKAETARAMVRERLAR